MCMNVINSVSSFAEFFAWKARSVLLGVSIALPVAVEGFSLGKYLYQNREHIPQKITAIKQLVIERVTRKEGEDSTSFHKRLITNVSFVLGAVSLAGGITCASFMILPTIVAIPAALGAISMLADLYVNGKTYGEGIKAWKVQVQALLVDSFTARLGEEQGAFRLRFARNVVVGLLGLAAVSLGVAGCIYSLAHMIAFINSGKMTPWNIYHVLPLSSPLGVGLMYGILGICHGLMACYQYGKGEKLAALYYLSNCIMAFVFPVYYYMTATPDNPMRVHHSFLGLFLQLLPVRCLKIYGAAVMWDSSLYFASADRGYFSGKHFHSYDYQNTILDNIFPMMLTWSLCSVIQYWVERIFTQQKPSDKTPALLSKSG